MSSTYICIIKKITFFRWSKTRKYFPILQNSHVEHICLVVEPPKVEEKSTWTTWKKEKKTSKKMCLMKKFTICWCLEEKKVLLKMEFFLPCSRATSSEEQKCLKKSLWKKPTLKKTNKIHLLLLTHLLHLSTWKKIEKKKTRKNYNKYTWSHLLKTCLMNTKWWNEISFSRKKISWKNDFTKKNAKISLLMSKTMRKKIMKR